MEYSAKGRFYSCRDPAPDNIPATPEQWLQTLPGPCHIHLRGADQTRCRAVVTLLHGNEPSGFSALHSLLKMSIQPVVDIHCFVVSVKAAQAIPIFSERMLPGHKDLNRCFAGNGETDEDLLAQDLLHHLRNLKPEAVIDIHNTSGSGPAFGVTTFQDWRHDALIGLFVRRVIVTDLTLGALMEVSDELMPTVTIECGGAKDLESFALAQAGLRKYFLRQNIFITNAANAFDIYHHPVRLELLPGVDLQYGSGRSGGVTLVPEIEHYNFGTVDEDTALGHLGEPLSACLTAKNSRGQEQIERYFFLRDGQLRPRQKLKLFMVTTNVNIAKSDCLFYLVAVDGNGRQD